MATSSVSGVSYSKKGGNPGMGETNILSTGGQHQLVECVMAFNQNNTLI